MPKTQISCQNCRQPIVADIERLFDLYSDPQAKMKLLSGNVNHANCPHCGFQGEFATPIVYHDPSKELLLTYFPPSLAVPVNEQERTIGPLITQVTNGLPQEQRKAYLFRPQNMLTFKSMVERILEADGVTKEMLKAQEERMSLIQNLTTLSDKARVEAIKQSDQIIDKDFFLLFARLLDSAMNSGDQDALAKMNEIQEDLIGNSTTGRQLQHESNEMDDAAKALQNLGKELSRENLLQLVIEAPNSSRVKAYVSLARSGMDYSFFQMLSERIESSSGKERDNLSNLREQILDITQEIDDQIKLRTEVAFQNIESLLQVEDIAQAVQQNIRSIDEYFMNALEIKMEQARESNDLDNLGKLQQIFTIIQEFTKAPPEMDLINQLLELADDEDELIIALRKNIEMITPEFLNLLTNLVGQIQSGLDQTAQLNKDEQEKLFARMSSIYNNSLKLSMEGKFRTD